MFFRGQDKIVKEELLLHLFSFCIAAWVSPIFSKPWQYVSQKTNINRNETDCPPFEPFLVKKIKGKGVVSWSSINFPAKRKKSFLKIKQKNKKVFHFWQKQWQLEVSFISIVNEWLLAFLTGAKFITYLLHCHFENVLNGFEKLCLQILYWKKLWFKCSTNDYKRLASPLPKYEKKTLIFEY